MMSLKALMVMQLKWTEIAEYFKYVPLIISTLCFQKEL